MPTLSPDNAKWDYKIISCRLPPYTRLLLADVDAGSDTPSMASKVLRWRKESGDEGTCYGLILGATYHPPPAAKLWTTLDQKNMSLVRALGRLVDDFHKDSKSYIEAARLIGALPASKVVSLFSGSFHILSLP